MSKSSWRHVERAETKKLGIVLANKRTVQEDCVKERCWGTLNNGLRKKGRRKGDVYTLRSRLGGLTRGTVHSLVGERTFEGVRGVLKQGERGTGCVSEGKREKRTTESFAQSGDRFSPSVRASRHPPRGRMSLLAVWSRGEARYEVDDEGVRERGGEGLRR